jgi:hypothetical protein
MDAWPCRLIRRCSGAACFPAHTAQCSTGTTCVVRALDPSVLGLKQVCKLAVVTNLVCSGCAGACKVGALYALVEAAGLQVALSARLVTVHSC